MSLSKRIVVFGGPYSNLQAIEAMRAEVDRLSVRPENVYCTGDLAAYCADPEGTVRACHDWGINVVQGNCEEQLGSGADDCGCGFEDGSACDVLSASWYGYARSQLSDEMCEWMAELPKTVYFDVGGMRACVLHGSYFQNNEFIFASTPAVVKEKSLRAAGANIVIAGHCGLPFIQEIDGGVWFNAGVIGMPANDGTRDGWYGLIEEIEEGLKLSLHRLAYDAAVASDRLKAAGFGDPYAKALVDGLWPSLDVLPEQEREDAGMAIEPQSLLLKRSFSETV